MKSLRFFVVSLLAMAAVFAFVACGGGSDTTAISDVTDAPETDAPVTDAPETDAPETEAPETEAPETEAPETEAPKTEPVQSETPEAPTGLNVVDGVFKSVNFDFETDLSVADYIASFGNFKTHKTLFGGIVENGKWVYDNKGLAIEDAYGIYDSDKFSIEFDFCFDKYITVQNPASVFTILSDDDGNLNEKSQFFMALRMSPDGSIYQEAAKQLSFIPELGKQYSYKMEIDKTIGKASAYIDGQLLSSVNFTPSALPYKCFRFMDNNKGAEMWIDNIVITVLSESSTALDTQDKTDSDFTSVAFDFETNLGVYDYIASFDGFSTNKAYKESAIVNGKWQYSENGMAIENALGIYDLDKFSVEFDFCFDKYITTENAASVFTVVTDDDGKLNGQSKFYMAMRMTADGNIYHEAAQGKKFKVELGKTHHYKIVLDRVAGKADVYVDGNLLCSPTYTTTDLPYCCFRFMDNNKGAEMWFDNIVITNLSK